MVFSRANPEDQLPILPPGIIKRASEAAAQISRDEIARKIRDAEEDVKRFRLGSTEPIASSPKGASQNADQQKATQPPDDTKPTESSERKTSFKQDTESRRKYQVRERDSRRDNKQKVRQEQVKMSETENSNNFVQSPQTLEEANIMEYAPSDDSEKVQKVSRRYAIRNALPKWYRDITKNSYMMKELEKKLPEPVRLLEGLKECINRCEEANISPIPIGLLDELRDHVHKAEIQFIVNKYIVRKSRILTESGLPRIFREESDFPGDLKADAYQLYNRWMNEDFKQDILRGIVTKKGKDRGGDHIDPDYKLHHRGKAKFYGEGDLVLGQWWPTQLCTVRDGAHGSTQGGIYGETGKGAYSVVLSFGSGYDDRDDGNTILYCGTEGRNYKPTENTGHLMQSCQNGESIRVIRSWQLPKQNPYRPEVGLRYDGLYKVTTYVPLDDEKAMFQFKLERCPGQEEIRYRGAAKRPTEFEVKEWYKLRNKV